MQNKMCVNIDAAFERYLKHWLTLHNDEYAGNMDVIEEKMPDIYDEFLNQPLKELEGHTPISYFSQFEDADELIAWLQAYHGQNIPIPDLLLDRIVELGKKAETGLFAMFREEQMPEELRMMAGSMLRELESDIPMMYCIERLSESKEADAIAESCLEMLNSIGEKAVPAVLAAVPKASETAKDLFAEMLSGYHKQDEIYELLIDRFNRHEEQRAMYASFLSKYGDERALPVLYKAIESVDLNYLDFIEIANAIESLGGERPADREFSGDPYYESLKGL